MTEQNQIKTGPISIDEPTARERDDDGLLQDREP
jgi:hypothetical protein